MLSAVFFTILLVAGNTMGQSVRERTEELGVLKAMGFTNELVLVLVLARIVPHRAARRRWPGWAWRGSIIARRQPGAGRCCPCFYHAAARPGHRRRRSSSALGLVAGILPALQAMRLRIADALRELADAATA